MIVRKDSGRLFPQVPAIESSSQLMGTVSLVFALIGIACAAILIVVVQTEISPYAITFNRLGIATLVFLGWHRFQHVQAPSLSPEGPRERTIGGLLPLLQLQRLDIFLLILSGLSFSGSLSLWSWSLTQTSVANATLLDNMLPIFTTLISWLLFRETFSKKFLLGMGVAIAGVIIISLQDLQLIEGCFSGDIAAMGASLLAAINILCIDRLTPRHETSWIMMWNSFIGSLFAAVIMLGSHEAFFPSTIQGWVAVIALAVISQALGQGLLTYSLKEFSAGLVTVSMLAIPVISALMAVVFFGESLSLINWCAFGVVLFGIYISVTAQLTHHQPLNASEGALAGLLAGSTLEEGPLEFDMRGFQDLPKITPVIVTIDYQEQASSLETGELAPL